MINYNKILNTKNYCVSEILIKEFIKKDLSLIESLLLIYFQNIDDKVFDIALISNSLGIDQNSLLEAFNSLITKNIISIETNTDSNGKIKESISLDGLYNELNTSLNNEKKEEEKESIYDVFKTEFKRSLTPIEYEIINAWLDNNTSEEIIIGALKEAVYNGAEQKLRYIDKIIYEWNKLGLKTMDDVKAHMEQRKQQKVIESKELFDYDWLDEDEV